MVSEMRFRMYTEGSVLILECGGRFSFPDFSLEVEHALRKCILRKSHRILVDFREVEGAMSAIESYEFIRSLKGSSNADIMVGIVKRSDQKYLDSFGWVSSGNGRGPLKSFTGKKDALEWFDANPPK